MICERYFVANVTIILILSDCLAKCHPLIFVKCIYSTGTFGTPMDDPLTSQLKDQCMKQRVISSCDHGAIPGIHIDRTESPQQLCRQDTNSPMASMEIVQIESEFR